MGKNPDLGGTTIYAVAAVGTVAVDEVMVGVWIMGLLLIEVFVGADLLRSANCENEVCPTNWIDEYYLLSTLVQFMQ